MICSRTLILGMSVVLIAVLLLDIERRGKGSFLLFRKKKCLNISPFSGMKSKHWSHFENEVWGVLNKNLTNLRYEVRVGASAFSPLLDNGALCIQLENTGIVLDYRRNETGMELNENGMELIIFYLIYWSTCWDPARTNLAFCRLLWKMFFINCNFQNIDSEWEFLVGTVLERICVVSFFARGSGVASY